MGLEIWAVEDGVEDDGLAEVVGRKPWRVVGRRGCHDGARRTRTLIVCEKSRSALGFGLLLLTQFASLAAFHFLSLALLLLEASASSLGFGAETFLLGQTARLVLFLSLAHHGLLPRFGRADRLLILGFILVLIVLDLWSNSLSYRALHTSSLFLGSFLLGFARLGYCRNGNYYDEEDKLFHRDREFRET